MGNNSPNEFWNTSQDLGDNSKDPVQELYKQDQDSRDEERCDYQILGSHTLWIE